VIRTDHPAGRGRTSDRSSHLTWSWDYLANQTEWTDDQQSFYERSLGAIVNGDDESATLRVGPRG